MQLYLKIVGGKREFFTIFYKSKADTLKEVKELYHLAVDIGASSGRVMLSQLNNERKITLKELHRFKNGAKKEENYRLWPVDQILQEILTGLKKAKEQGVKKCTLGIDTWGVDYCLLNKEGNRIGGAISYRDPRTENAYSLLEKRLSLSELYEKTGIQIQPFNTVFQLLVEEKSRLQEAESLLFMPDYLNYLLTGKKFTERTIASTSQLLNIQTGDWDEEILSILNLSRNLFPEMIEPGEIVGNLQKEKFPEFDLPETEVMAIASHDTASAVLGAPANENSSWAYISSGTWSLLGLEKRTPLVSKKSYESNYTNEGGVAHTTRFLKNIMGMWLIQEVSRSYEGKYSFPDFVTLAKKEPAFTHFIDVNDSCFLHPEDMVVAIQKYCQKTEQSIPETPGQFARIIYDNLALCYAHELKELEKLTNSEISTLHIVGGGGQNEFLNQLTADCCQIEIIAGPTEATAIGNIMMQMLGKGIFKNIFEARKVVAESFSLKKFVPEKKITVIKQYEEFLRRKYK